MSSESEVDINATILMEKEQSDDDISDTSLKIIEDSPRAKKRPRAAIKPEEQEIIRNIERDLEEQLDKKAAKSNLTNINVKNILKHVVTNEHVLALVRQVDNPEENISLEFEPKLTRAKAKELFPSQTISAWLSPTSKASETQVLISEELQEDSSGDEYIPAEEESEDDKDSSILSESDSLPNTPKAAEPETNWSVDGIFKIPRIKSKEEIEEEANIALRTRSKFCLSDTPLETLTEAFIPPDITTDMYDMDCYDDDWKNFLKQFTRPLDEVTKGLEDEDHDPEYNVLADEEIDKVDEEELRADRAVKVTRKELNALMAELFEYADNFTLAQNNLAELNKKNNEIDTKENQTEVNKAPEPDKPEIIILNTFYQPFRDDQKLLLQQQMRQHVQFLTQHFLLTYEHPDYHKISPTFNNYLVELKNLSENNPQSFYSACNLDGAIKLVEDWKTKFETADDEVQEYKKQVDEVIYESKQKKIAGIVYIPTFPKYFLEVVSKSTVFLYPSLLPRIPFKTESLHTKLSRITEFEDNLIALGLEQFIPFLAYDSNYVKSNRTVRLKDVCSCIVKYLMPGKEASKLYSHIQAFRNSKYPNPIKHYFENKHVQSSVHYVSSLGQTKILPPCQRPLEELPEQWRLYIYPERKLLEEIKNVTPLASAKTKITKTPALTRTRSTKRKRLVKIFDKPSTSKRLFPSPTFLSQKIKSSPKSNRCLNCSSKTIYIPESLLQVKFNSSIFKRFLERDDTMLPSMPNLGSPFRCFSEDLEEKIVERNLKIETIDEIDEKIIIENQKDNIDDINALMVASSTIRNLGKKRPTGAEKKKAKLRREFSGNLRMLSPEDEQDVVEKTDRFVQAFYDKVQEQLELHDYHKFMEALNDFDEKSNSVTGLYEQVETILGKKHPDLLDEFLTFFTSVQAKSMNKVVPHLMMNNMSLFLRKLEMIFKDQPSQVKKIYRCLTELVATKNVTMAQVKNSILPLLKGSGLLTDWFLQIFPSEKPSERLLQGPWETIEIGKENALTNEDYYETIVVPEIEDPYGGPNCICTCHNVDDITFKSRQRHCIPCGTKFLQGRVFVQTGKGLRLAKVSFEDNSIDHLSRLSCRIKCKRSDGSPAKQISPGKDSQDENRISSDEEPEKKQQRLLKTTKKRKPKKKIIDTENIKTELKSPVPPPSSTIDDKEECLKKSSEKTNGNTSDSSLNDIKLHVEENIEWDCNTSIESVELELKLSPENASPESESEFCEETSQDNNTDSEGSAEESERNSPIPDCQWTRNEDKIILETFRREENKELAFRKIAEVLENRSMSQIKDRFDLLINLLKEMSKSNSIS